MLQCRGIRDSDWPRILEIQRESYISQMVETLETLQSRWHTAPECCFVVEDEIPMGYALAHPWREDDIPALNVPISNTVTTDILYVHDVAISQAARGCGAAALLIQALIEHARVLGLPALALTSVQGSAPFWQKHQFQPAPYPYDMSTYGDGAIYMKHWLTPPPPKGTSL